jgi:hypothetical protein
MTPLGIVFLGLGLGAAGGFAYYVKKHPRKGVLTPERRIIFEQAMANLKDPAKLRELADVFDKEGLPDYAQKLRMRAAELESQPQPKPQPPPFPNPPPGPLNPKGEPVKPIPPPGILPKPIPTSPQPTPKNVPIKAQSGVPIGPLNPPLGQPRGVITQGHDAGESTGPTAEGGDGPIHEG